MGGRWRPGRGMPAQLGAAGQLGALGRCVHVRTSPMQQASMKLHGRMLHHASARRLHAGRPTRQVRRHTAWHQPLGSLLLKRMKPSTHEWLKACKPAAHLQPRRARERLWDAASQPVCPQVEGGQVGGPAPAAGQRARQAHILCSSSGKIENESVVVSGRGWYGPCGGS